MADLKVTYDRGRKDAYCSQVKEGERGLYLLNEDEEEIGWLPYDTVDYVRGKQTAED